MAILTKEEVLDTGAKIQTMFDALTKSFYVPNTFILFCKSFHLAITVVARVEGIFKNRF